jgi:hypothetical protein
MCRGTGLDRQSKDGKGDDDLEECCDEYVNVPMVSVLMRDCVGDEIGKFCYVVEIDLCRPELTYIQYKISKLIQFFNHGQFSKIYKNPNPAPDSLDMHCDIRLRQVLFEVTAFLYMTHRL